MKRKVLSLVLLVLLVGIAACAPNNATPLPATEAPAITEAPVESVETEVAAPTEAVSEDAQTAEPAAMDVEALILEKLAGNHSIQRVYAAQKTREEWNTTLDRMIGYGAKISEEEKQIIIDYLLSR